MSRPSLFDDYIYEMELAWELKQAVSWRWSMLVEGRQRSNQIGGKSSKMNLFTEFRW